MSTQVCGTIQYDQTQHHLPFNQLSKETVMNPLVRKSLLVAALSGAWIVQYLVVVPAVYSWRFCYWLVALALKMGVLGILLLCLPIVGWIILVFLLVSRHQHTETMAALGASTPSKTRRNVLRPYGLSHLN